MATMALGYEYFEDRVEHTLTQNSALDPDDTTHRYIRNIWKMWDVPQPPYPCLLINLVGRAEQHRAIGYVPFDDVEISIKVICGLPSPNSCSAALTALGYTAIINEEQSKREVFLIVQTIEGWLRGDDTDDGHNRRMLYMQDYENANVKIVEMPSTTFSRRKEGNLILMEADIRLALRNVRLLPV